MPHKLFYRSIKSIRVLRLHYGSLFTTKAKTTETQLPHTNYIVLCEFGDKIVAKMLKRANLHRLSKTEICT